MYKSEKGKKISESKRMKLDEFISRANQKHNNKYNYSNTVYVNAHTYVKITCPIHGEWNQKPMDHITGGYGCPACGNISKGISKSKNSFIKFLKIAKELHDNKYQYDEKSFEGMTKPMTIICSFHGEFKQTPDIHKRAGCQRCGSGPVSNMSQEWLDSLLVPKSKREVWIKIGGRKIKVDGFDKDTNTIYEFWGNYWHGNPLLYESDEINSNNKKTFGELYSQTQKRIEMIKSSGYNLIDIWESDWLISISDSTKS